MATPRLRRTGLSLLGDLPWGSHACHLFQTRSDLLETLIPFFKAGLEGLELCLWVIHALLTEAVSRRALEQRIPDAERHLAERSIEIVSSREWYFAGAGFSQRRVLRAWDAKVAEARARGYEGLRANGNVAWLEKRDWRRFGDYERGLDESIALKPMIVLCSYALEKTGAVEVLDIARTHQFAIAKRAGQWQVVEWRMPPTAQDRYDVLTSRERDVLILAVEGESNPRIARALAIGVRTVETHRANLLRKLGVRNQTELVRYALQRRFLLHPRTKS
jgi:DNA-binding CsgD family transcriptional regulator